METSWWTSWAVTGYAGLVLIVLTAGFPSRAEIYAVVLEPDVAMSLIGGGAKGTC